MLKYRIISSAFIIGTLAAAYVWGDWYVLCPIVFLLTLLGLRELFTMLDKAGLPGDMAGGMAAAALVQGGAVLAPQVTGLGPETGSLCGLALGTILVFIRQMRRPTEAAGLQRLGSTLFAVWYVAVLANFLNLLYLQGASNAPDLLLYLIVVVKCCDTGAYFTGKLIGRHKLVPKLSPGKTWEGCVGGLVFSTACGLLYYTLTGGSLPPVQLRLIDAIVLPLLLSVVGIIGDLAESLIKRSSGVKDSSDTVPGMGGVLDIIDSLLLTAPVLYCYVVVALR